MGLLGNLVNKISPNLLTLANWKEGRLVSTIWVAPIAWATSKVANQTNRDSHTKILSLREIPLISRHRVYRKWSHQAPSSSVKPVGPTEVIPHHLACGTEDGQQVVQIVSDDVADVISFLENSGLQSNTTTVWAWFGDWWVRQIKVSGHGHHEIQAIGSSWGCLVSLLLWNVDRSWQEFCG